MAKTESTQKAASKLLGSKTASRAEKWVAASALTQIKGKGSSKKTVLTASKILNDPKASKAAKTVAASALTQWPQITPGKAKVLRDAVVSVVELSRGKRYYVRPKKK